MNLLVTLNEAYVPTLKVMLRSLFDNCKKQLTIYIMYTDIGENEIKDLAAFVKYFGHTLYPLPVNSDTFSNAPVNFYYSKEMYYRLFAYTVLPSTVDKVLYLDPDILVLNPIEKLYNIDLGDYLFAAAAHDKMMIGYINKIRLKTDGDRYYNSGVLLMNIKRLREDMDISEISGYVEEHASELILPDQDVLNGLYWDKIMPLDECLYNYDARRYSAYLISTKGKVNMEYIIYNTVIMHFCGKQKPWHNGYPYRFGILYKHYKKLAERDEKALLQ
ncbi:MULTISPECIES: glycosyltransferase family 8 protein [Tissierellales]|jgi:lipopolysaccharide biosynthesis glycosyltransferase|uniref:Glycosyltransferase family 8 protein n=1 Tax=Acidilutibacter cellobiosedens TaxID=2507161 RepID=A0A410QFZ8_9FIRM|nr:MULTISPECIES: glycosyltransferase family 8 protein [Tissierellales]QAT62855.1 glycosyltransferase family 8 protein [Acidilutibacter cellobiosedens]SCL93033.1 General stress protein A [Sporanaerobacter sp. PP17-6a]